MSKDNPFIIKIFWYYHHSTLSTFACSWCYLLSARKHIKFEIDSFRYLLAFLQVIDTNASNYCKKAKI